MSEFTTEASGPLSRLRDDSSLWFWFTDRGPGMRPALVLRDQEEDPEAVGLAAAVRRIRDESFSVGGTLRGVAKVGATGALTFISDGDSVPHFCQRLAMWAGDEVGAHPALRRLTAARQVIRAPDGSLGGEARADNMWRSITLKGLDPVAAAGLLHLAGQLAQIEPGDALWFAFVTPGAGGVPALLMRPRDVDDEKGSHFADTLALYMREVPETPAVVRGHATVSASRRLCLSASTPAKDFLPPLSKWVATYSQLAPGLGHLVDATYTRVGAGRTKEYKDSSLWTGISEPSRPMARTWVDRLTRFVTGWEPGQVARFAYLFGGPGVSPVLTARRVVDDPDGSAIKGRAKALVEAAGDRPMVRGTVQIDAQTGRTEFRSKQDGADFLAQLAHLVWENADAEPSLLAFRDAIFLQMGPDKTAIRTIEEPALWEGLPDEGAASQ